MIISLFLCILHHFVKYERARTKDGVAVQIASRSHLRLRRPAGLFYAIPLQIPVYQAHSMNLRWLGAVGLPETPQKIFAISVCIQFIHYWRQMFHAREVVTHLLTCMTPNELLY